MVEGHSYFSYELKKQLNSGACKSQTHELKFVEIYLASFESILDEKICIQKQILSKYCQALKTGDKKRYKFGITFNNMVIYFQQKFCTKFKKTFYFSKS